MRKILSLFAVLLVMFTVGIKGAKAEAVTMTREFIDGVWSYHYRGGDWWTFGNLPFNYANGKLVYCIEPDSRINTDVYYTYGDFGLSGYSEDTKRQMELISYYGYGFPGHDSLKYYMATQELLWLFSPDDWIKWTVTNDENSEMIDVSYEKNEIQRLVNNHNRKPSFYGQIFESETDYMTIRDVNNVLDNYRIEVPDNITYSIDGDRITFKTNKIGSFEVNFKKKRVVNETTLVYNNDSLRTQKLAIFGEPYFEEFKLNIVFKGSYVEILKKDIDTNEIITDSGNKIKIKNTETNQYVKDSEYEFNGGKVWLYLPVGKYFIEETNSSNGYYINTNGLNFEIVEGDEAQRYLEFFNDKVEGRININKTDDDGNNLSGAKFEIYNENNELVDTVVTNEEKTSSIKLPLGKYTVKEVEVPYGYEKNNEEYEVELSYNNQDESIVYGNLDIINKKIKCEIVVVTTSKKEALNVSFNVYDKNNNLVYSGNTVDGKSVFYLPYGDYVLKEIGVPDGYKLNDNEIKFSVNDITCASKFSLEHEKFIMPNTTSKSSMIYLVLLIINISGYVYYKKCY